jgi:hypothetical protein
LPDADVENGRPDQIYRFGLPRDTDANQMALLFESTLPAGVRGYEVLGGERPKDILVIDQARPKD